ncbi:MAG TPA: trypsin-like peptidase domain-containing protein [Anaerolineales bacterium]|nr:trypsin-like peptidase domain-containing protein [Anaerolineales bacterium]
MSNPLTEFSNNLTTAVEKGGEGTLLVDARKRYPASGIAYANDLVLTADHVLKRDNDIKVGLSEGKFLDAAIVGRDSGSDLALLRIPEKALTPVNTSDEVKVGQLVLALGRPSGSGVQSSWGIVTSIHGPARTHHGGLLDEFIKSETTPYPGFSGGPLINTEGEVLGLNTSGLTHGSSLTISAKAAWRIADALAKHGSVKRGYLGVRTQPVSNGLLVMWLEEKGPAEKGGILVGDILVSVGDQKLSDPDDLFSALHSDIVGKPTAVEVLRGGKPETLKITIGERK